MVKNSLKEARSVDRAYINKAIKDFNKNIITFDILVDNIIRDLDIKSKPKAIEELKTHLQASTNEDSNQIETNADEIFDLNLHSIKESTMKTKLIRIPFNVPLSVITEAVKKHSLKESSYGWRDAEKGGYENSYNNKQFNDFSVNAASINAEDAKDFKSIEFTIHLQGYRDDKTYGLLTDVYENGTWTAKLANNATLSDIQEKWAFDDSLYSIKKNRKNPLKAEEVAKFFKQPITFNESGLTLHGVSLADKLPEARKNLINEIDSQLKAYIATSRTPELYNKIALKVTELKAEITDNAKFHKLVQEILTAIRVLPRFKHYSSAAFNKIHGGIVTLGNDVEILNK